MHARAGVKGTSEQQTVAQMPAAYQTAAGRTEGKSLLEGEWRPGGGGGSLSPCRIFFKTYPGIIRGCLSLEDVESKHQNLSPHWKGASQKVPHQLRLPGLQCEAGVAWTWGRLLNVRGKNLINIC